MPLSTGCCGPRGGQLPAGAGKAFLRRPSGEGEMEVVLVFMAFKKTEQNKTKRNSFSAFKTQTMSQKMQTLIFS